MGEALEFVAAMNALMKQQKLPMIDHCMVYDDADIPSERKGNEQPGEENGYYNARDYLLDVLPILQTSGAFGALFQFSSRNEFNGFYMENRHRYDLFPATAATSPVEPRIFDEARQRVLREYTAKTGSMPQLRVPPRELGWAYDFYLAKLPEGALPITLSFEEHFSGNGFTPHAETWLSFIDKCQREFPDVVFVTVGPRGRRFEGFRGRENVIIANDYGATAIEQMALVSASGAFIGTDAGLASFVLFSSVPYVLYQGAPDVDRWKPVLSGLQRVVCVQKPINSEQVFDDFTGLFHGIQKERWFANVRTFAKPKHGHPTSVTVKV